MCQYRWMLNCELCRQRVPTGVIGYDNSCGIPGCSALGAANARVRVENLPERVNHSIRRCGNCDPFSYNSSGRQNSTSAYEHAGGTETGVNPKLLRQSPNPAFEALPELEGKDISPPPDPLQLISNGHQGAEKNPEAKGRPKQPPDEKCDGCRKYGGGCDYDKDQKIGCTSCAKRQRTCRSNKQELIRKPDIESYRSKIPPKPNSTRTVPADELAKRCDRCAWTLSSNKSKCDWSAGENKCDACLRGSYRCYINGVEQLPKIPTTKFSGHIRCIRCAKRGFHCVWPDRDKGALCVPCQASQRRNLPCGLPEDSGGPGLSQQLLPPAPPHTAPPHLLNRGGAVGTRQAPSRGTFLPSSAVVSATASAQGPSGRSTSGITPGQLKLGASGGSLPASTSGAMASLTQGFEHTGITRPRESTSPSVGSVGRASTPSEINRRPPQKKKPTTTMKAALSDKGPPKKGPPKDPKDGNASGGGLGGVFSSGPRRPR